VLLTLDRVTSPLFSVSMWLRSNLFGRTAINDKINNAKSHAGRSTSSCHVFLLLFSVSPNLRDRWVSTLDICIMSPLLSILQHDIRSRRFEVRQLLWIGEKCQKNNNKHKHIDEMQTQSQKLHKKYTRAPIKLLPVISTECDKAYFFYYVTMFTLLIL